MASDVIKRFSALTAALLLSLGLAACSSFSYTVTDYWPTWAGGMPKDVPPRPGAPGYEEFIAHQQAQSAAAAADTTQAAATAAPAPAAKPPPNAAAPPPAAANAYAPAPPAVDRQGGDQAVAQGGLY